MPQITLHALVTNICFAPLRVLPFELCTFRLTAKSASNVFCGLTTWRLGDGWAVNSGKGMIVFYVFSFTDSTSHLWVEKHRWGTSDSRQSSRVWHSLYFFRSFFFLLDSLVLWQLTLPVGKTSPGTHSSSRAQGHCSSLPFLPLWMDAGHTYELHVCPLQFPLSWLQPSPLNSTLLPPSPFAVPLSFRESRERCFLPVLPHIGTGPAGLRKAGAWTNCCALIVCQNKHTSEKKQLGRDQRGPKASQKGSKKTRPCPQLVLPKAQGRFSGLDCK